MEMKAQASPASAVVIADLVGSRAAEDRRALHRQVMAALDEENARVPAVAGWRVTVGDEFQAVYAGVADALRGSLRLRLALLTGEPGVDVRFGIGWGITAPLDEERGLSDGPAWWAARDAIVDVEAQARRPGLQHRRTAYRPADGDGDGPDPALVEAVLVVRDQAVGALSARSVRLLLGTLEGRTQQQLAEAEGISPSAVSQRARRDGIAAIVATEELLGRMQEGVDR